MMNKGESPTRIIETPVKLNNLERKIESISETLSKLVEKKKRSPRDHTWQAPSRGTQS